MKRLFILLSLCLGAFSLLAGENTIDEISRLRQEADSLHNIGKTDSAAIVGEKAISLAVKSGDPVQIVGTRAAQGVFLRSLGKIDEALKSYDEALKIVTSGKFRENLSREAIEEIASLYINLAVLNLDTQNKELAAKNAIQSAEWVAKSDDTELKSTVYGVVGSVLTGCGELEKALSYQEKAYSNALSSGNQEAAFRAAAYTMLIADRLGNRAEAQKWREQCNDLIQGIESSMAKLVYYQAECSICLKHQDNKGAIVWFDKILNLEGIDRLPFVKFDCYNNMHAAYAALGDYKNAYSTVLESNQLRDSIWQQEKTESLRELTVKYETKETELALAQSESRRARTLMWLFAAIGLIVIGAAIFIIYAGRQRRRRLEKEMEFANLRVDIGRKLTQQYVEGLENERLRMSKELHDGVSNDLMAIQMNIRNHQSVENALQLIETCRESVRRISHELMPPEFAYATLDEVVRFYVAKQRESFADKVNISYLSDIASGDIERVSDQTALEVYRIIQESVTNALKHSGASEVSVELSLHDDLLEAVVRDNGNFNNTGKKGIGLESIRRRANSIGAKISIDHPSSIGTCIKLSVKV